MEIQQNCYKRFYDGFQLFDNCTLNKKSLPKSDMGNYLQIGQIQDGHHLTEKYQYVAIFC